MTVRVIHLKKKDYLLTPSALLQLNSENCGKRVPSFGRTFQEVFFVVLSVVPLFLGTVVTPRPRVPLGTTVVPPRHLGGVTIPPSPPRLETQGCHCVKRNPRYEGTCEVMPPHPGVTSERGSPPGEYGGVLGSERISL
jgi:hypothetical protein